MYAAKQLLEWQFVNLLPVAMQLKVLAPVDELQRDPESRSKWIFYSALDAKTTHELYYALRVRHAQ